MVRFEMPPCKFHRSTERIALFWRNICSSITIGTIKDGHDQLKEASTWENTGTIMRLPIVGGQALMLYGIDWRWVMLLLYIPTYWQGSPESLVTLPFSVQSQGGIITGCLSVRAVSPKPPRNSASCQISWSVTETSLFNSYYMTECRDPKVDHIYIYSQGKCNCNRGTCIPSKQIRKYPQKGNIPCVFQRNRVLSLCKGGRGGETTGEQKTWCSYTYLSITHNSSTDRHPLWESRMPFLIMICGPVVAARQVPRTDRPSTRQWVDYIQNGRVELSVWVL